MRFIWDYPPLTVVFPSFSLPRLRVAFRAYAVSASCYPDFQFNGRASNLASAISSSVMFFNVTYKNMVVAM